MGGVLLTFDFEWAELPDDIAWRKQQAWQQWEDLDARLQDPTHPLVPVRTSSGWPRQWAAIASRRAAPLTCR